MTPDERARFMRWCAVHLPAYCVAIIWFAIAALAQTLNILDGDNSGDEGWLFTLCLLFIPVAVNVVILCLYGLAPRINRALVAARRKSPHRPDTDLRVVYRD